MQIPLFTFCPYFVTWFLSIVFPLLCVVDVWWYTSPCSMVVHFLPRQSLLYDIHPSLCPTIFSPTLVQSALVTTRRSGSMTSERVVSEARYSFCRQGELPSTSMLHWECNRGRHCRQSNVALCSVVVTIYSVYYESNHSNPHCSYLIYTALTKRMS